MKKPDQSYQYEVKTPAGIATSSPSGLILGVKSITLELESNFPLTKREIETLTFSIFTEIKKHCESPDQTRELQRTKTPSKSKTPIPRLEASR